MTKSLLFSVFLPIVLWSASPNIQAASPEQIRANLAAEDFQATTTFAQNALKAAIRQGDEARQLDALDLLVDNVIAQHRFIDDETEALNQRAIQLTRKREGEASRRMAKRWAVEAWRELQLSYQAGAAETHLAQNKQLIARSTELLANGSGDLPPADIALIYAQAARAAQNRGEEANALSFATKAEAAVHQPQSRWETRWRAAALMEVGAAERSANLTAAGLAHLKTAAALALEVAGDKSLLYADSQSRLGQFQQYTGDFTSAELALQTAIGIYRAHPDITSSVIEVPMFVLANTLMSTGRYDRARPLFEDVLRRSRGDGIHFGSNYPAYLNSFAMLEQHLGDDDRARDLLQQSAALLTQLRGETSPVLLPVLCNLGDLELKHHDVDDAERTFQRAAVIVKANGDKGYWKYFVDFGLGGVALAKGIPADAETLLAASIVELEALHGERHPDMLELRCSHALALARIGKTGEAFDEAETVETYRVDTLLRVVPALDETSALHFKQTEHKNCSGLLAALAVKSGDADPAMRAWNLVARARGLVTSQRTLLLASARTAADESKKKLWSDWQRAAQAYATALLHGSGSDDALRKNSADLDAAEAALGAHALTRAGLSANRPLASVLKHLPAHGMLLAYAKLEKFDIDAAAKSSRAQGEAMYGFVSDASGTRIVALGDSVSIRRIVGAWYALLREPASDITALSKVGAAVRDAIWNPLVTSGTAKRVFAVPDDTVFRVNFAALPDTDGFLVEHGWRMHILEREDDLAPQNDASTASNLLLVGNPDFGLPIATSATARIALCDSGFTPLPGTAAEVQALAHLWNASRHAPSNVLEGKSATKEAMEHALTGVGILHIATHTLTMDEPCSDRVASRNVGLTATMSDSAKNENGALAFAGANSFLDSNEVSGILTGAEVLTLPLDALQWVVLSACDTGLGDIVGGEGVFGLRRAFRLAGARTVIMSLWKVDDDATSQWMQALYGARIRDHVDTPEAVTQADLAVLRERRARGASTHPFYWAGFIAAGDWR